MRAARPVPARPVPPPAAGGALSQSGPAAVTGPPPPRLLPSPQLPRYPGEGASLPSPHTHFPGQRGRAEPGTVGRSTAEFRSLLHRPLGAPFPAGSLAVASRR